MNFTFMGTPSKPILDYSSGPNNFNRGKITLIVLFTVFIFSIALWIQGDRAGLAIPVFPYGDEVIALGVQDGRIYLGEYADWEKKFYETIAIPCWGFTACSAIASILAARSFLSKRRQQRLEN